MLSDTEQRMLTAACRKLQRREILAMPKNYVLLVLGMVLDFQMRQQVVDAAFEHFKQHHHLRSHRALRNLIERFSNSKAGHLALARTLWNNNMWTRAQYLRLLVERFEERGGRTLSSLSNWVAQASFESDVHLQFMTKYHSMGYTMFQYLRMRLGHDTIKPDSRVLAFVDESIQRKSSPKECVQGIEAAANSLRRSARELDAAIYSRDRA